MYDSRHVTHDFQLVCDWFVLILILKSLFAFSYMTPSGCTFSSEAILTQGKVNFSQIYQNLLSSLTVTKCIKQCREICNSCCPVVQ